MFDINNEKQKLSLSGASSEKQKESSLILRKAKFQAIFKFVLSSASGGAGGGKYNRISAFVSMPVLLIRRSLEKFFKKNFRDDFSFFVASPKDTFYRHSEPKAKNPKKTGKVLSFLRLRGASGAQGISAPASCRKAHKRRFLFNSWILRFVCTPLRMTIPTLAFLLSLNLSTAFADCNCDWGGEDGKTLTITGCSAISSSSCKSQHTANNVIIGTGVTSIGDGAFSFSSSLTSITIPDSVTSIGTSAFAYASSLTSITIPDSVTSIGNNAFQSTGLTSITIPEGVTSIGGAAFYSASSLKSIIIPDNIDTENWDAMVFQDLPSGTENIVCQGDLNTCYENLAKYFTEESCPQNLKDAGKGISCSCSNSKYCISPDLVKEATDPSQCSGNYGWSGAGCSRKNPDGSVPCASGFVEWDKECWSEYPFAKKRWTPAEANEWLHDGNDNFVVITFKK